MYVMEEMKAWISIEVGGEGKKPVTRVVYYVEQEKEERRERELISSTSDRRSQWLQKNRRENRQREVNSVSGHDGRLLKWTFLRDSATHLNLAESGVIARLGRRVVAAASTEPGQRFN